MKHTTLRRTAYGALFLAALLLFLSFFSMPTQAASRPVDHTADALLLYCFNTDTILYEKEADKPLPPGATAKLMTALLVLERYRDLNEIVTLTAEHLEKKDYVDGLLGFEENARFTVNDLLAFMLLGKSDFSERAAALLANLVAGDAAAFTETMNARAEALGMTATLYQNPTGKTAEGAFTCARDVYHLVRLLYTDSRLTSLLSRSSLTLSTGYTVHNSNALISSYYHAASYLYSNASGMLADSSCLVATADETDGYSYLCVILGSDQDYTGENAAYTLARSLFQWARSAFAYLDILSDARPVTTLPIEDGDGITAVPIFPQKKVSLYLPKNTDTNTVTYDYTLNTDKLYAPCEKNQIVGELTVYLDGKAVATCPLVTGTDVTRSPGADFRDTVIGILTGVPAILLYLFLLLLMLRKILLTVRRIRRRKQQEAETLADNENENT